MMRVFDILLPITGTGLLLALVIMMARRRSYREYRFFFAYAIYWLLAAALFALVSRNDKVYSYVYWISNGFGAVLMLFALNEVWYKVFHRFYSFWWFRLIFPLVVVVVCFFAVRHVLITPPPSQLSLFLIFYVNAAVSLIPAGIFLVFMLLAMGLHVRWHRHAHDIALGFAVSGMGDWIAYFLQFHLGYGPLVRYVPPLTYICATLMWLVSFTRKFEPDPKLERQDAVARSRRPDASSKPKLSSV